MSEGTRPREGNWKLCALISAIAILAAPGPARAGTAPAEAKAAAAERTAAVASRELEGRIVSVNRKNRSFVLRWRSTTVRIYTTRTTRYEDVRGFAALRAGMRVEVTARRTAGRWIARKIERED